MSALWSVDGITVQKLNHMNKGTIMETIGIEYTEVGDDYICGQMPVSTKTVQPFKMLHGGASCVLAETLGSVASNMIIDQNKFKAVGMSINTQHLKSAHLGETVHGKATAIHLGSKSHLWNIDITNESGKLISTTRLTMAILGS